jgi:hypothetical protein
MFLLREAIERYSMRFRPVRPSHLRNPNVRSMWPLILWSSLSRLRFRDLGELTDQKVKRIIDVQARHSGSLQGVAD